jgi:type II secretory pathway predicted ATPase ExeA
MFRIPRQVGAQTEAYIGRHLAYAGADRDVFTDGAMDDIYRFSRGAARLINKLCNRRNLPGQGGLFLVVDQRQDYRDH